KPATEPWLYGGNFSEDLRAWLLACEDFFNWNPTEWETETDCIKYAVGRTKDNSKGHDFGISYCRSMEGIDGYPLKSLFTRWAKFKAEIIERFEPKQGAILAKQEMDSLRYKNDISDYLEKIRSLNYRVKMTGVSLRSLILAAVPAEIRNQLIFAPTYNDDDDWMELVQRVGQTLELAKRQEKLLEVKEGHLEESNKDHQNLGRLILREEMGNPNDYLWKGPRYLSTTQKLSTPHGRGESPTRKTIKRGLR